MTVKLIEVEPGKYRVKRTPQNFARSELPLPYVISDIMPATEQVDGKFYTSKRAFRAVGRSLGLTEVGNEKFKPKTRSTDDPQTKKKRAEVIGKAIAEFKAGCKV